MLTIGTLQLPFPVVQAPLAGYSDRPMRLVSRRHGAGLTMGEMVLDRIVGHRPLVVGADEHPIGGQLLGSDPEPLAVAADAMVRAGFDVVDLNFGCPVKKALGRCRGGYLLTAPDTAIEIVRAVVVRVAGRCPVTLKLRRGFDDSPESERNFFAILDGAIEAGAAAVTVHPRTVEQRFKGRADWEFLARVKRRVGKFPILGSGDLFTAEAVRRMMEETGVDGVTLARGAIGNPFIFRECRAVLAGEPLPPPPTYEEELRAMEMHLALAVEEYGPRVACLRMRKFWGRYPRRHPHTHQVKRELFAARTPEECRAILAEWYGPGTVSAPGPVDCAVAYQPKS